MTDTEILTETTCYHCGDVCEETHWLDDKPFCCYGCQTVFEILNANNLCEYYTIDNKPGIQQKSVSEETYAYLNEKDVRKKILTFDSETFARAEFFIPAIHCASCIWLLENLHKLDTGIVHSEVNFTKKLVTVSFNPSQTLPGSVARLLASLGYVPRITLEQHDKPKPTLDRSLVLKLAVAGFCFGNVMLFSFPEYLGIDHSDKNLISIFAWLNLGLSVPVFLYSAKDYFTSALKSFKQKQINIDVPIAIGLVALFFRSTYDIITATGPGYFDSFTGLVFFLLIGRWFQTKTYESLAFDRDFTAYFPLAVNRRESQEWKPVVIYKLVKGDQVKIRNMELIPADSILLDESAYIDYSFVTGEARPVHVKKGDLIYAGGRLIGTPITLVVDKPTSQSHLTNLWNNDAFKKVEENKYQKIIDRAARRFTWIVLGIACITAVYWYVTEPASMWLVITAVLMVACPCALALAAPFTFGNMMREFGKRQLYLKNADVIERMAAVNTVVFDKTGTITHGQYPEINFTGELSEIELGKVKLLTSCSTHPLSVLVSNAIKKQFKGPIDDFKEIPGKGIQATVQNQVFRIGSAEFTGFHEKYDQNASHVFISIDDEVKGFFTIRTLIRNNMKTMLQRLGNKCKAMLSGDHDADKATMQKLFNTQEVALHFNQSPQDKLDYIRNLQQQGHRVMMLGDGLNDAGALKQSDVGIAVTDDTGIFTPACDGILHGSAITQLDKMLDLAKTSATILKTGFIISFCYNAIALSFAVSGHLTPLVAAILMPISSISVVSFTSIAVRVAAKRTFNRIYTLN